MNPSPERRAVHASATATSSQQGPISQKADEPDTLIIGDSTIKDITDSGQTKDLEERQQPARHYGHGPSPIADAGLARNGHPPPLHSPIDDDLQPHLSHSHKNNSTSTVSSLFGFPAEFKKLEYVGIKLASVSMIASPQADNTQAEGAPCTDSSPEYY
ncbi:unnamed protein product [Boreogadus saida]